MELAWGKCEGSAWCNFDRVNVSAINTDGVYIIWHGGQNARVVYVGQGNVAVRISAHRGDPRITQYRDRGLYVTWAYVASVHRDGVEAYLAERWNPLVGDAHPAAMPIAVNSPW